MIFNISVVMKKCAFFALLVFINLKLILFICRWSFKASAYISIRACYLCFSILTFKKICCIASTISQFFDCKDQIHDDDDDHNDDELFLWYRWPTKGNSPYFQPGPYCQRLYHHRSPTHYEQKLNLHRTWVQLSRMELHSCVNYC